MQKDILEIIAERRSIAKVLNKEVSEDLLLRIIKAGTWAPNHKRTEPWRFTVFTGEKRQILQDAIVNGTKRADAHLPKDEFELKLGKMEGKAFRAPAIIAVWCAAGRGKLNPPIWEDYAAVSSCLQNMSLAAHALGLGSIWRSGSLTSWPEIEALCKTKSDALDTKKGDKLMGFLYVGYPDPSAPIPKRDEPELEDKVLFV